MEKNIFDFIKEECCILTSLTRFGNFEMAGYRRDNDSIHISDDVEYLKFVYENKKFIITWECSDEIKEKFDELNIKDYRFIDLYDVNNAVDVSLKDKLVCVLINDFEYENYADLTTISEDEYIFRFRQFCKELGFFISIEYVDRDEEDDYEEYNEEGGYFIVTNCHCPMEKVRAIVYMLDYFAKFKIPFFDQYMGKNIELKSIFETYKINKKIDLIDNDEEITKKRKRI